MVAQNSNKKKFAKYTGTAISKLAAKLPTFPSEHLNENHDGAKSLGVAHFLSVKKLKNKFIKTECGLNKYEDLKSSKTFFGRVRFYWFVFIASLRDKILKF